MLLISLCAFVFFFLLFSFISINLLFFQIRFDSFLFRVEKKIRTYGRQSSKRAHTNVPTEITDNKFHSNRVQKHLFTFTNVAFFFSRFFNCFVYLFRFEWRCCCCCYCFFLFAKNIHCLLYIYWVPCSWHTRDYFYAIMMIVSALNSIAYNSSRLSWIRYEYIALNACALRWCACLCTGKMKKKVVDVY